jgi:long-chain acyl-CoA synthetase
MIKSGGLNVFPADIEPVLLSHDAVEACAVVGVPHPKWGETPVGFVVLSVGYTAEPGAVQAWVNERVEKTQRLRDLVIVDALPRNSIGKVIKGELREQYGDQFSGV